MPSLVLHHLVFSLDVKKYKDFPLGPNTKKTIGRNRTSDLLLIREEDLLASKNHATIEVHADGSMVVCDVKTVNGTYINGKKIDSGVATEIKRGDIVSFGTYETLNRRTTSISFLVTEEATSSGQSERKRKRDECTTDESLLHGLTCSVCSDPYLNPVVIECGHTFCDDCLLTWIEKCKSTKVTCPECRHPFACKRDHNIAPCKALCDVVEHLAVECLDKKELKRRHDRLEILKNKRAYARMRNAMVTIL